jgi:hypothetical protein
MALREKRLQPIHLLVLQPVKIAHYHPRQFGSLNHAGRAASSRSMVLTLGHARSHPAARAYCRRNAATVTYSASLNSCESCSVGLVVTSSTVDRFRLFATVLGFCSVQCSAGRAKLTIAVLLL